MGCHHHHRPTGNYSKKFRETRGVGFVRNFVSTLFVNLPLISSDVGTRTICRQFVRRKVETSLIETTNQTPWSPNWCIIHPNNIRLCQRNWPSYYYYIIITLVSIRGLFVFINVCHYWIFVFGLPSMTFMTIFAAADNTGTLQSCSVDSNNSDRRFASKLVGLNYPLKTDYSVGAVRRKLHFQKESSTVIHGVPHFL